jgi:general secretion pathway protein B
MSYILDALRRSQAERERGQLPHLHAQPASLGLAPATAPARSWLWPGLAVLVLLLLLGAAVLLLWRQTDPAGVIPPAAALPPTVVPSPAAAAAPAAVTAVPAAAPPLPIVVSAPPAAAAPVAPAAVSAKPDVLARAAAKSALPAPVAAASTAPLSAPAKAEPVTLTLAQLSPEQKRDLPPLVVGGSVWSDNAASRFVILNGQLLHEGESAAPGAVVERIGPKTAWVRWREWRLELPL